MAYDFGAGQAVTTAAARIGAIPAGVCDVVISNTGSTNVIYLGGKSTVTDVNGFPLPAGDTVTIHGYPGSAGTDVWAVAAATGNNIALLISTAA